MRIVPLKGYPLHRVALSYIAKAWGCEFSLVEDIIDTRRFTGADVTVTGKYEDDAVEEYVSLVDKSTKRFRALLDDLTAYPIDIKVAQWEFESAFFKTIAVRFGRRNTQHTFNEIRYFSLAGYNFAKSVELIGASIDV